jgi:hypothetical protein
MGELSFNVVSRRRISGTAIVFRYILRMALFAMTELLKALSALTYFFESPGSLCKKALLIESKS